MSRLQKLDRRIREAIAAFPAALRPRLIRILELPDEERAAAIGEVHREALTPQLAELLIDLEEEPVLRGLVLAELRKLEATEG